MFGIQRRARIDGGRMGILKTLVLAAAVSLGLTPPPAGAQNDPSPQALEAARALTSVVSVSMMSELTASMNNQVWPGLEAAIRSRVPAVSPAALAELRREFERQQVGVIFESMNDAAVIYARHFTVQEMREMTAFYQAPTGRKALTVMPRLMLDFAAAMAPRLQNLEARVFQLVANMLNQANAPAQPGANPQSGTR
jgi:hypothetical protein